MPPNVLSPSSVWQSAHWAPNSVAPLAASPPAGGGVGVGVGSTGAPLLEELELLDELDELLDELELLELLDELELLEELELLDELELEDELLEAPGVGVGPPLPGGTTPPPQAASTTAAAESKQRFLNCFFGNIIRFLSCKRLQVTAAEK